MDTGAPDPDSGIDALRAMLESGETDSVSLVGRYVERIGRFDRGALNSVLYLSESAASDARRLDEERKGGRVRGPLHGIPILIKGNIDTGDTMPTTAGSLALAGSLADADAPLVARLKEAGAIILGKTNLSEWANFRSTHSSSGWSAEGGQTRNPYASDRSPSGSSSGSGVAVSAGFCAAAVGTETDGSIISPSSVNGIVGLKPTVGAIPGAGIIPISASQDTAGPMARSVRDAAILLEAMCGSGRIPGLREFLEASVPRTSGEGEPVERAGSATAERPPLEGLRLGVTTNFCGFLPAVDSVFAGAKRIFEGLGATLVEMELKPAPGFDEAEFEVMLFEFKAGIAEYLAARLARLRGTAGGSGTGPDRFPLTLEDLIAFNTSRAGEELRHFGQELFEMASVKPGLDSETYRKARALCIKASRTDGIDAALDKFRLDAIIAPSGGPAWKIDHILGDHYVGGSCTSLPAAAGYPHLTVPMGFIEGLPVGLSLFGTAWTDARLLSVGWAYERASRARKPPRMPASSGSD